MLPSSVVVLDKFTKDSPEMALVQRDQEVQALPSYRARDSFAMSTHPGASNQCLDHSQSEAGERFVDLVGEHAVAVVNDIPMAPVAVEELPKLLPCPLRRRMIRPVVVQNAPRADFNHNQDVPHLQRCGYRGKEVTGSPTRPS